MEKELNVEKLYSICKRLVEEGRGNFPVVVMGRNRREGIVDSITIEDGNRMAVRINKSVRDWSED